MSEERSIQVRTGTLPAAVAGQLSRQEWAIVRTLQRVRVASATQLERLHFHSLPDEARRTACSQALDRLVKLRVLTRLDWRIGQVKGDSAVRRYALDVAGLELVGESSDLSGRVLGEDRLVDAVTVTEVLVALMEHSRSDGFTLEDFRTGEAACWPDGLGDHITPDAFIRVGRDDITCSWWLETDREPEAVLTTRSRLRTYADFLERDAPGPGDVAPRVLVGVLTGERAAYVRFLIDGLPERVRGMFVVAPMPDVAQVIARELR